MGMIIDPYRFAVGATGAEIDRTLGTNIGNMTSGGGLAAAFDGTQNQAGGASARTAGSVTSSYVGKTGAAASIISKCTAHGSNNVSYNDSGAVSITLELYGKTGSAPASATDGTMLGSITFTQSATDESAGRDITSSDTATLWDHWWLRVTCGSSNNQTCAEARFFQ